MTIRQEIIGTLIKHGMYGNQAEQVFERFVATEQQREPTQNKWWDDDVANYPSMVIANAWLIVRREAISWIDQSLPQAWASPAAMR